MDSVAGFLQDYLEHAVRAPEQAFLDLQALPQEWRALGKSLVRFTQCVVEANALANAIAKGNLSGPLPPPENAMAAPLKALHASLKHLTWQTQQVVKGDYQQRVDFMGEFSEAFNAMTAQLERQRAALLAEIELGRQKAKALEQGNVLFEAISQKTSQWIIVAGGVTFEWLYANRRAADALHDPNCALKLRLWMREQAKALKAGEESHFTELELEGNAGTQYFSVEIHPLYWHEHNAFAFTLTDISAQKKRLHLLQSAVYIDMPTKLFNRSYALKILNEWVEGKKSFVLCFVDIDNLKQVNDRFGHGEGDVYIQAVAQVLSDFSPEAVPCRMGGDEFIILAQGYSGEEARNRMEMLRFRLINHRAIKGGGYGRSISYGVVEISADNLLSAQELLDIADEKMYEYKRAYKLKSRKQRGGMRSSDFADNPG